MSKNIFDIIILNGRPASGKSEVIDYLKMVTDEERERRFHIGKFDEIDDFPMLWTWFEEDEILENIFHKPRIYSDFWHLLIERISIDYSKKIRDDSNYHDHTTSIIEFSRGTEHGGYKEAYKHLSDDILNKAAIFYIDVSFEESVRKNRNRFNPDKPDSILEHGLPDSKLKRLYGEVDWEDFIGYDPEYITIKGHRVPYVVFHNEPDITTERGDKLGIVMEKLFRKLWEINLKR